MNSIEAIEAAIKEIDDGGETNQYFTDVIVGLQQALSDLEVLEIIKKHPFLDLSVLADYDISEFDEYYDDWHDTTNELDRKEFELLKEWLDNDNK